MSGPSTDLRISLNHLKDLPLYQIEKPYEIWAPVDETQCKTNVQFEYCDGIPVADVRGRQDEFDIETCGFSFLHHPVGLGLSAAEVKTDEGRLLVIRYLEEMSSFLQQTLSCRRVLCYDWRVRRANASSVSSKPTFFSIPEDGPARDFVLDVAQQVHADESPRGVERILEYLLNSNEKSELKTGRYRLRLINLWRPNVPVVKDHALAVCDRRTVYDDDWEPVDKVHQDWVEEGMYLRRRERHRWYWLSDQTDQELIAFLVWDSDRSKEFRASVPHCAFKMPHEAPRKSIMFVSLPRLASSRLRFTLEHVPSTSNMVGIDPIPEKSNVGAYFLVRFMGRWCLDEGLPWLDLLLAFLESLAHRFRRQLIVGHDSYTSIFITAPLQFIRDLELYQAEKPYYVDGPLQHSFEHQRSNLEFESVDVAFEDARPQMATFSLSKHGFKFIYDDNISQIDQDLQSNNAGIQEYLDRVTRFRKNIDAISNPAVWVPTGSFDAPDKPVQNPHIDQTKENGMARILRHLTAKESTQFPVGDWRFRIVNIWRPLNHHVHDAPLAFCSSTSLIDGDLVACDRVSADYVGEIYYVRHNPRHQWYWLRDQSPKEFSLFVSYDSDSTGDAAYCAHASFINPIQDANSLPRESVEVRAIIVSRKSHTEKPKRRDTEVLGERNTYI
ncbi:hypothetical protein O1611_g1114 [Lasiodiplodia mahajangana]|uniref:Uncharacterized protein n=1 Tax=Lasiodiplodia mahajangana TaxID=1108764 RepID=A0ACC2JZ11_9PEZI|nr:hypothetical protein O1611_g1114 [Lasiodiplodia mahajangana]